MAISSRDGRHGGSDRQLLHVNVFRRKIHSNGAQSFITDAHVLEFIDIFERSFPIPVVDYPGCKSLINTINLHQVKDASRVDINKFHHLSRPRRSS